MMQMLAAGGIELMTDGVRAPDEFNPQGYLEWEEARHLPRDPAVIEKAHGKAVKIVSPLLPHLHPRHRYKVIFMERPVAEVAASQARMLESIPEHAYVAGEQGTDMATLLARHLEATARLLEAAHLQVLRVPYVDLLNDGEAQVARIARFLDRELDTTAMLAEIRPELRRVREA